MGTRWTSPRRRQQLPSDTWTGNHRLALANEERCISRHKTKLYLASVPSFREAVQNPTASVLVWVRLSLCKSLQYLKRTLIHERAEPEWVQMSQSWRQLFMWKQKDTHDECQEIMSASTLSFSSAQMWTDLTRSFTLRTLAMCAYNECNVVD